jgi:hypothetical protein
MSCELVVCGVPFGEPGEQQALQGVKDLGFTSVQIYTFWRDLEPAGRGQFDWSALDRQVWRIQEAGLKFVYAGNLPGSLREYENTCCPNCQTLLIERTGYVIHNYQLTETGVCPSCGTSIPGIWTGQPQTVRLGGWGRPRLFG